MMDWARLMERKRVLAVKLTLTPEERAELDAITRLLAEVTASRVTEEREMEEVLLAADTALAEAADFASAMAELGVPGANDPWNEGGAGYAAHRLVHAKYDELLNRRRVRGEYAAKMGYTVVQL